MKTIIARGNKWKGPAVSGLALLSGITLLVTGGSMTGAATAGIGAGTWYIYLLKQNARSIGAGKREAGKEAIRGFIARYALVIVTFGVSGYCGATAFIACICFFYASSAVAVAAGRRW